MGKLHTHIRTLEYRLAAKPKKKVSTPDVNIPTKLKPFVDGTGNLGNVESWKVKVHLGNSMGEDDPDVGGWGEPGYVFINPDTQEVIPIARSDEHHAGHDLLRHFQSKGLISNASGFYSVFIHGTHVYDSEDKEPYKKMFKTWLDLGGKDLKVEIYSTSNIRNEKFLGTLTDFIQAKTFTPVKGEIAKPGRELILALEKFAKAVTAALKDPNKEKQVFKLADTILMISKKYDAYTIINPKALESALASNDFQTIQDAVLGFNGLKNSIHQKLRKPEYDLSDLTAYFGDIKEAKKAFDALGNL